MHPSTRKSKIQSLNGTTCQLEHESTRGPTAERSKSSDLDRGRGDPSLNPSEGCYVDGEQKHTPYCLCMLVAEDHELSIGMVCEPLIGSSCRALYLLPHHGELCIR